MASAMTLAMMSPFAAPLLNAVRQSNLWYRAHRETLVAYLVFVCVWLSVSAALHVSTDVTTAALSSRRLVAGLLAAGCAVEVLLRSRTRRVDACRLTRPIYPTSSRLDSIQLALTMSSRCVRACVLPMALTMTATRLTVVLPVAALMLVERLRQPRPRVAVCLGYVLVCFVCIAG